MREVAARHSTKPHTYRFSQTSELLNKYFSIGLVKGRPMYYFTTHPVYIGSDKSLCLGNWLTVTLLATCNSDVDHHGIVRVCVSKNTSKKPFTKQRVEESDKSHLELSWGDVFFVLQNFTFSLGTLFLARVSRDRMTEVT